MSLIREADIPTVRAIAQLVYCNPFLPERLHLERQILGDAAARRDEVWHPRDAAESASRNLRPIGERARLLAEEIRGRLMDGAHAEPAEIALYQDLCIYVLYHLCRDDYLPLTKPRRAAAVGRGPDAGPEKAWSEFSVLCRHLIDDTGVGLAHGQTPETLFACFFQVRRAFEQIFFWIAGASLPAARLRAQVWQSVFTHDLRRYQRSLFARMGDVTTLITGPSGAGKELVARAIGLARYIPFDSKKRRFEADPEESFFPLNLSALSPTLIESELFGHMRGAFTGAVADRRGWLDVCPPTGTVFLDEIGEVAPALQVKLLRVLETRTFQPLGSSDDRQFHGKIIAATNRDLGREMREGRFREDLYYRLCADTVVAPSLRERIADRPDELDTLVRFLAERLVGEDEAAGLTREAVEWITANLGRDYAWPGNVRELSHCISNVMIHADYRPASRGMMRGVREALADDFTCGELPLEEVLRRYTTLVFARERSYVRAAELLGVDRRTVKARVDADLLARLHA
jgi:transcriptional regulator with AAA-type ATPase domain